MVQVTAQVKHGQTGCAACGPTIMAGKTGQPVPGQPAVPPCIFCRAHHAYCYAATHIAAGPMLLQG